MSVYLLRSKRKLLPGNSGNVKLPEPSKATRRLTTTTTSSLSQPADTAPTPPVAEYGPRRRKRSSNGSRKSAATRSKLEAYSRVSAPGEKGLRVPARRDYLIERLKKSNSSTQSTNYPRVDIPQVSVDSTKERDPMVEIPCEILDLVDRMNISPSEVFVPEWKSDDDAPSLELKLGDAVDFIIDYVPPHAKVSSSPAGKDSWTGSPAQATSLPASKGSLSRANLKKRLDRSFPPKPYELSAELLAGTAKSTNRSGKDSKRTSFSVPNPSKIGQQSGWSPSRILSQAILGHSNNSDLEPVISASPSPPMSVPEPTPNTQDGGKPLLSTAEPSSSSMQAVKSLTDVFTSFVNILARFTKSTSASTTSSSIAANPPAESPPVDSQIQKSALDENDSARSSLSAGEEMARSIRPPSFSRDNASDELITSWHSLGTKLEAASILLHLPVAPTKRGKAGETPMVDRTFGKDLSKRIEKQTDSVSKESAEPSHLSGPVIDALLANPAIQQQKEFVEKQKGLKPASRGLEGNPQELSDSHPLATLIRSMLLESQRKDSQFSWERNPNANRKQHTLTESRVRLRTPRDFETVFDLLINLDCMLVAQAQNSRFYGAWVKMCFEELEPITSASRGGGSHLQRKKPIDNLLDRWCYYRFFDSDMKLAKVLLRYLLNNGCLDRAEWLLDSVLPSSSYSVEPLKENEKRPEDAPQEITPTYAQVAMLRKGWNALLVRCMSFGSLTSVQRVAAKMNLYKIPLRDDCTHSLIIFLAEHSSSKDWNAIITLIRKTREAGYPLDLVHYRKVFSICLQGAVSNAKKQVKSLQPALEKELEIDLEWAARGDPFISSLLKRHNKLIELRHALQAKSTEENNALKKNAAIQMKSEEEEKILQKKAAAKANRGKEQNTPKKKAMMKVKREEEQSPAKIRLTMKAKSEEEQNAPKQKAKREQEQSTSKKKRTRKVKTEEEQSTPKKKSSKKAKSEEEQSTPKKKSSKKAKREEEQSTPKKKATITANNDGK